MPQPEKLGSLFLYTVPSNRFYDRQEIIEAMHSEGLATKEDDGSLSVEYMPDARSDTDAFRLGASMAINQDVPFDDVTGAGGGTWRATRDAYDRKVKVRVTDVDSNDRYIQKDIVQEVVKGKYNKSSELYGNNIEASIAKVMWRKDASGGFDDQFVILPTKRIEEAVASEFWAKGIDYTCLFKQMYELVNEARNGVDSLQMRAFIRETMERRFKGTSFSPVRGTNFVPLAYSKKLEAFVRALSKVDYDIYSQTVPLYDEKEITKRLRSHVEGDLEKRIRSLIEDIDDKKASRADKRIRLQDEIEQYRDMLNAYDGTINIIPLESLLEMADMKLDTAHKITEMERERRKLEAKRLREEARHLAMSVEGDLDVSGSVEKVKGKPGGLFDTMGEAS